MTVVTSLGAAFAHPYLQNALAAGLLVALAAGCVGYFVVVRGAAFATHALSQVGFAGAAGAVLIGVQPLLGLVLFALLGALGLGLGTRARGNDVTTALVLVAALGTGALFLALGRSYGSNVFALLFGTIVGVDRGDVAITACATAFALVALLAIARPLLFATVSRDAAIARGVPVAALDLAFLAIVALSAAIAVPVVGTLLIYSLTVGPAAAAVRLSARPAVAMALAVGLAAFAVAAGLALAVATDWPVGFFIATVAALEYAVARIYARPRTASTP